MNYDSLILSAVTAELNRTIVGGRIQGVRQHNDTDLTLEIRGMGATHLLFLSVKAVFPRVYITASRASVPQTPPNFCMLLRKYVQGSFITEVSQCGFDRILHIRTEAPDGNRNLLVLELMGKHSNFILLSDSGRILGAAKNISAALSKYRQILPGLEYLPPPGGEKTNPITVTREEFDALWRERMNGETSPEHLRSWLIAVFQGVSPFLAEEILFWIDNCVNEEKVWGALMRIKALVEDGDYNPQIISDDRGNTVYAYPIPTRHHPTENQHARHSMNETLDALYRSLTNKSEFETEYARLETSIRRAAASRRTTMRHLQKAVADGERAERYKELGELVMAAAGSIEKGQTKVTLIDYYDPNMPEIEADLDEKLTAKENAERYFRRYRKAKEGASTAVDRISNIETELSTLDAAMESLQRASVIGHIEDIKRTLLTRDLLRSEAQQAASKGREEPEFGGARIRRLTSPDGMEILYGENATSNDYLTTKVAKPNDLWFHARSVIGAHVVIRTGNKPERTPLATIRAAAQIAARNSNARHSSLVPVDYTLRKHVRKPRGAAPGFVTYQMEKTIDIVPETR